MRKLSLYFLLKDDGLTKWDYYHAFHFRERKVLGMIKTAGRNKLGMLCQHIQFLNQNCIFA